MEKTYKFILPQNKEVEKTNIRIENGEVFVDAEFKEKFQPKDGDFLVSKLGNVFIFKNEVVKGQCNAYVGSANGGAICFTPSPCWTSQNGCRFATYEEKADFLARLEKEYKKKWNAEKKCLEDIYIPKFMDIVKVCVNVEYNGMRNYMICIFPNKPLPTKSESSFFDIANTGRSGELYYNCGYIRGDKIIRASESEKQELYDKLAEVGKRWNPETKQIEDIRWNVKKNELYYYVESWLTVDCSRNEQLTDELRIAMNNCYKTEEAAQKVADQIKEIFKNSKAE